MRPPRAVMLVVFVALSLGAGYIGGRMVPPVLTTYYAALLKPDWTPAPHVFTYVWTALYVVMGMAAWLVWDKAGFHEGDVPLLLYFIQLALNTAWSWIFFGLQRPGAALVENIALWCMIVGTIVAFWRVRKIAAALLVPYLAWVTFAVVLNATIWRMN